MHKVFSVFVVIFFACTLTFAQGRDDHNDSGPIQAGFAVITPTAGATSGTTSGLVVFETFGVRSNNGIGGTTQAGVLPPGLTTNAVLFVNSSSRLSNNLGVAIVNPNSSNVNVTMTLNKNDGSQLATTTVNIPARQQISKFVTELFARQGVPADVTGTVTVTSTDATLAVSVIGLRFRGSNFSTLPATSLSSATVSLPTFASGIGGTGAILLPQFAAGGGWVTELVLANTGPTNLTVRVDLFNADGTPLSAALNGQTANSFTNVVIPAGGVVVLAPRNTNVDDDF